MGCKIVYEAWTSLENRYASISKARVNTLKTEFQTLQQGADSIEQYLPRLKNIKERLLVAGEFVYFVVATLFGLPRKYSTIRTIILIRDTSISLREFRE